MIYLIKDECGDIFGVVQCEPAQIESAQHEVNAAVSKARAEGIDDDEVMRKSAEALGLATVTVALAEGKADLLYYLLTQRRGVTEVEHTLWKAGL